MEYELAKKLKDAGFPQDKKRGHFLGGDGAPVGLPQVEKVYIPTFSELIKAVTTDHDLCDFSLSVTFFEGENGELIERWRARKNDGKHDDGKIMGSSPKEAVGNLFLALNHKE